MMEVEEAASAEELVVDKVAADMAVEVVAGEAVASVDAEEASAAVAADMVVEFLALVAQEFPALGEQAFARVKTLSMPTKVLQQC